MAAIPYCSLPGILVPLDACDYPLVGDVEEGVVYASGSLTGTLALPAEVQVRAGVGYGEDGLEFTGIYAAIAGYIGINIINPNTISTDCVTIGDIRAEIIEVV